MTKIVRLSPQTTIERDEQGTAWIVTSDSVVAAVWLYIEGAETWWWPPGEEPDSGVGEWTDLTTLYYGPYRIPLLDAWREVYEYRECEPGIAPATLGGDRLMTIEPYDKWSPGDRAHLNAAILCAGSSDSLRAFIAAVREEEA